MKRKFLLALLSIVMVFSATLGFVACGDGEDDLVAGRLEYVVENNEATCIGPVSSMLQKAEIQAEYEGAPVTAIRAGAFKDCIALRQVDIPASVKKIPDGTFVGCDNLEKINLLGESQSFKLVDGNLYNKNGTKLIQYILGKTATTFTLPGNVTQVANFAFASAKNLQEVIIGNDVERLGLGMLYSSNVKTLTVPFIGNEEGGDETSVGYFFKQDENSAPVISQTLTKITTNGMSISEDAFEGCTNLTEIVIGKDVQNINAEGFSSCSKLQKIEVDSNNSNYKSIDNNLYNKAGTTLYKYAIGNTATTLTLSADLTEIADGALLGCLYVSNITVASGNTAFKSEGGNLYDATGKTLIQYAVANSAKTFAIPSGVETISAFAFANAKNLTAITIPNSVKTIETSAFANATKLAKIVVPNSVETMQADIFEGCTALAELSIPYVGENVSTNKNLGYLFAGNVPTSLSKLSITNAQLIAKDAFLTLKQLTTVTLNEGITAIEDNAFNSCSGLTAITIPSTVTSIGKAAFKSCKSIGSIVIPNQVTTIGESAFFDCSSVATITLGEKITTIGKEAFSGCLGVTQITIPASVTEIGDLAFYGATGLTSIVVAEGNTNYKAIDGDLYTLDETVLIQYATGKPATEYTVPSNVVEIKENAFRGAIYLTKITVPNTVTAIGKSAFEGCVSLQEVIIPFAGVSATATGQSAFFTQVFGSNNIKKVTITNQEKIAPNAFGGSAKIETVVLGSTVKEIGNTAFRNCSSLANINLDNVTVIGNTVFQDCIALTSLSMNAVQSIGDKVFAGCTGITTLAFGANLATVGLEINDGCTALKTITVDSANANVSAKDNALYVGNKLIAYAIANTASKLTIKDNTNEIGTHALEDAINLTEVVVPSTVALIGNNAFARTSITTIALSATNIGEYVFSGCAELETVNFGNALKTLGAYAFENCSSLTSINLPEGVTEIGTFAFSGCTDLETVSIPSSVETIGAYLFRLCDDLEVTEENGATYVGNTTNPYLILIAAEDKGVDTVTINTRTKFISELAFMDCKNITTITIPASVRTIGAGAFMNCESLLTIVVSNGVKVIGDSAFYNCDKLTQVVLPNSVEVIGSYAFSGCDLLRQLKLGTGVTELGIGFAKDSKVLNSITVPEAPAGYQWQYVNADGQVKVLTANDLKNAKTFTQYRAKDLIVLAPKPQ